MKNLKLWAAFIVLLLLSGLIIISIPAAAAAGMRFEALGGTCRYSEVGNYIWQNDKYEINKSLSSGCGMLAVSSVPRNAGTVAFGWRVAYTELGTASIMGVYPLVDEEQKLPAFDGAACNPSTASGCLGRGYASQSARGVSAGWVGEWRAGPLLVGGELGLYVYDGEFNVTLYPEPKGARSVDWMSASGTHIRWRGIQATPFVGVTLRHEYLMAMVRVYGNVRAAEHGCGYCSGLAKGPLTQVLVGLSINF